MLGDSIKILMAEHFNIIVIGDNHTTLTEKYDASYKVEPYVVFKFSEVKKIRERMINERKTFLEQAGDEYNAEKEYFKLELSDWEEMSDIEFYEDITTQYEIDEKTGNAITRNNPNEKYRYHNIARNFAIPFYLKNGEESFSARKCDIDWEKTRFTDAKPYEIAWDTVMEGKKPKSKEERVIFDNMKERTHYFSTFGSREYYIKASTSFWAHAILSEKDGWVGLERNMPQFDWVINFYDKFIKPLPEDTLLTIYECVR